MLYTPNLAFNSSLAGLSGILRVNLGKVINYRIKPLKSFVRLSNMKDLKQIKYIL